ncbi:hypothetical protein [Natronolimnohabitans innermongolicus]|uniref:Uncharacterized protein n=1 Tax=Natronolimnohabitans innermongolicus JCM 12255 TaxID=1227499 RepID=L9WZ47_9EURY|nr:hypothetical protein [Natronolimnohabitans innermongolicus]ELY53618.1 hypothetical protein C493_13918 [Natronolimnohabitans innermongolicus JCM 12255]
MGHGTDDAEQVGKTATEQQILKVFDYGDGSALTASEVAATLERFEKQASTEDVRNRLEEMAKTGSVSRISLGARAVGWRAEVAPELAAETVSEVEERKPSDEWKSL